MSGSPVNKTLQAPGFGAVMSWQKQQLSQVPPFVHFGNMKHPAYSAPGFAGYLGRRYDPYLIDQDPNAADFSVRDFSATVYHALGLDPKAERSIEGRKVKMLPEGRIVQELL